MASSRNNVPPAFPVATVASWWMAVAVRHVVCLGALMSFASSAATGGELASPVLEFLQPTNGAVFSSFDEIPVLLRASIPQDVILGADVLANNVKVATTSFCCTLCPCAHPQAGQETLLQIPSPWVDGHPPSQPWQGWTNAPIRTYRLVAKAVSELGTVVFSSAVTIHVIDRSLRLFLQEDGTAALVIPEGSMVSGGYDLQASEDLRTWTRLGAFSPGNVAAFYWDPPDPGRKQRFYRSVFTPVTLP